jgi:hypothetical protein
MLSILLLLSKKDMVGNTPAHTATIIIKEMNFYLARNLVTQVFKYRTYSYHGLTSKNRNDCVRVGHHISKGAEEGNI